MVKSKITSNVNALVDAQTYGVVNDALCHLLLTMLNTFSFLLNLDFCIVYLSVHQRPCGSTTKIQPPFTPTIELVYIV